MLTSIGGIVYGLFVGLSSLWLECGILTLVFNKLTPGQNKKQMYKIGKQRKYFFKE